MRGASVTTDVNGGFSCTFTVPSVSPATYPLSVGPVVPPGTPSFTVTAPTPMVYSEVLATSGNIQLYALPGAEEFTPGASTVSANYAEVYLAGTGTAYVSIGTTLFGTDVVSDTPVSVSGAGWYIVHFSAVLNGGAHYYLNVHGDAGVQWGYTVNPSTAINDLQDYYYVSDTLTHDDASPNLYIVGYQGVE